jgi:Nickel responsive protein SCO4226-like
MAEFLVELYLSRADGLSVGAAASERARVAAEALTVEGALVRFVRAIFVPEDETCFFLYQAASAEIVREAARRAGLLAPRVSCALDVLKGEEPCR